MKHLIRAAAGALLIPVFALGAAPASAQVQETFRIGFVNPDRVLREAQPAKAAQPHSYRCRSGTELRTDRSQTE